MFRKFFSSMLTFTTVSTVVWRAARYAATVVGLGLVFRWVSAGLASSEVTYFAPGLVGIALVVQGIMQVLDVRRQQAHPIFSDDGVADFDRHSPHDQW